VPNDALRPHVHVSEAVHHLVIGACPRPASARTSADWYEKFVQL
jgi:hypothetical protein